MAKNIRGVTVEIGAETKGLNAALKDVRKESRKISRELYQVNRALKFNPDSVELWEQKQELLTGRIEETRKELDALKQSQDEIEKKFKNGEIDDAQYREFKRDIVQAESKLDTFERQLKETQKETSKFGRAMKDISDETKKAGDKLTNIGQNLNQNVTLPLVAAFTALTVGTRDFRKTLAPLQTNAEAAGVELESMDKIMGQLNAVTGDLDSNVEGVSSLLASGFKNEQMTEVVNQLSGAVTKFPDTLKFENLSESLQETIATGKSVGQFEEMLDRVGIEVESFEAGLQKAKKAGNEQNYVLQTLAKTGLSDVYEQYKNNNEALVESAEANYDLQSSLAELGEKLEPIMTDITRGITVQLMLSMTYPKKSRTWFY